MYIYNDTYIYVLYCIADDLQTDLDDKRRKEKRK